MLFKADVYANLWHPALGQEIFCQYMKKYVQILHPFGNIEDKFH